MIQQALYTISNGVYILGAKDKDRFAGSTVDAVSQIAVMPNLIIASCSNTSHTKACIEKTNEFSLSVLPLDISPFIIANFGYQSSRDVDKWAKISYDKIDCLPYIPNALAKIRLHVIDKLQYTFNTLFVAEAIDAYDVQEGEALSYKYYRDVLKPQCQQEFNKHKMIAATTCVVTEKNVPQKKWVCTLCEYVYDGEIPFEKLPDDWRCPLCGVGKAMFELRQI